MNTLELLETGKEKLALRIKHFIENNKYSAGKHAEITIQLCYIDEERASQKFSFYNDYWNEKNQYKDIQIHASAHTNEYNANNVSFDSVLTILNTSSITLERAEKAVKKLKPIQKKLDKIEKEEGETHSLSEQVMRIARVLKAKAFICDIETINTKHEDAINYNISELKSFVYQIERNYLEQLKEESERLCA